MEGTIDEFISREHFRGFSPFFVPIFASNAVYARGRGGGLTMRHAFIRVSREGRKARGKRRGSRRVHTHAENVCRELSPAIDPRSLVRSRRHSYVANRGRGNDTTFIIYMYVELEN